MTGHGWPRVAKKPPAALRRSPEAPEGPSRAQEHPDGFKISAQIYKQDADNNSETFNSLPMYKYLAA